MQALESQLNYQTTPNYQHHNMIGCILFMEILLQEEAPKPSGKNVVTTTFVDANLYHGYLSGKVIMGILQLVNGTIVDWYSKKQSTVETVTYCREFVAAHAACNLIINICMTLQYMGLPIDDKAWMFGDNKLVITSSNILQSQLNK